MGAYKLFKNTPNGPTIICPEYLLKPKILDFVEKRILWSSVVRAPGHSGGRQSAANFEFS